MCGMEGAALRFMSGWDSPPVCSILSEGGRTLREYRLQERGI